LYRVEVDVPEFEAEIGIILEENGFNQDALNRGVIYFNHRYWNEYLYGILKPDWEAMQEVSA